MKLSILSTLAVLTTITTAALADNIADCKSGDHYTNLDKDYNTCTAALKLAGLDDKSKAELLFARGETLYFGERFDLALLDLDEASKLTPNYRDAQYRRARVYEKLQRYADAFDELTSLLEKNAKDTEAVYAIGALYESGSNQPEKAIEYYKAALNIDPNYILARIHLAILTNDSLNKPRDAIKEYEVILDAGDEKLAKLRVLPRPDGRSMTMKDLILQRYTQAKIDIGEINDLNFLATLNALIERNPSQANPLQARAKYFNATQQYYEALKDGQKAIDIAPYDGSTFYTMIDSINGLHHWQEGIDLITKVLNGGYGNYRPDYFINKRAYYEERLDKREAALADYEASIQMDKIWTPDIISRLIRYQYYEGTLSDAYNEKIRDGLKACIIDPEC